MHDLKTFIHSHKKKHGIDFLIRFGLALVIIWTYTNIALAQERSNGEWKTLVVEYWDTDAKEFKPRTIRIWDSFPELNHEFSWTGSVNERGEAHGEGELVRRKTGTADFDNKAVVSAYYGTMKNGKKDGTGVLHFKSSAKYDGEWEDDMKHGIGKFYYANGDYYEGEFQFDKMHGKGLYASAGGEEYQGLFADDKKHGNGIVTLLNGTSYNSTWKKGIETEASRVEKQKLLNRQVSHRAGLGLTVKTNGKMYRQFQMENIDVGWDAITYRSWFRKGEIHIEPDFEKWHGWSIGDLIYNYDEFKPAIGAVYLDISFENQHNSTIEVVGGDIDVNSSKTDLQPFIIVQDPLYTYPSGKTGIRFTLWNDGWGQARNCVLEFNLSKDKQASGHQEFAFRKNIGTLDDILVVDVEDEFKQLGVDIERLNNMIEPVIEPLSEAEAREIFGVLAPAGSSEGYIYAVQAHLIGRLSYDWTDVEDESERKHSVNLHVGFRLFYAGGDIEKGAPGPVNAKYDLILQSDKKQYRLPFPFKKSIPQGSRARIAINLSARKSSYHKFRVTLRLSDGTVLSSPYCKLRFFIPRYDADADEYFGKNRKQ